MRSEIVTTTAAGNTNPILQIPALQALTISATVYSSGNETGTLKFQACNDNTSPQENLLNTALSNWVDISGATVNVAAASTVYLIPKTEVAYQYIRAVYTHSAGAGNVTINVCVKTF